MSTAAEFAVQRRDGGGPWYRVDVTRENLVSLLELVDELNSEARDCGNNQKTFRVVNVKTAEIVTYWG